MNRKSELVSPPFTYHYLMTDNLDKVDILIVDDQPDKLIVLESILAELGENVLAARSGPEALRLVLQHQFAVILLDVNMPGMDGFETASLIRKRKKSAHTPIIFLTAFADEMHTTIGYSLGAVDYILTPVVPEVLRTKVRVFVDLFRMTQQARRQADERVALAREQAARTAAEEASKRSTFLAGASKVLAASLDRPAIIHGLLRLSVPLLCDLGCVELFDPNGGSGYTELAWFDKATGLCTLELKEEMLCSSLADAVERVRATSQAESLRDLKEEPAITLLNRMKENSSEGPDFKLTSALVLPLLARGSVIGGMTVAMGPSGRPFSDFDSALLDDLVGRAAIALDNARLYHDIQESDRHKNEFLAMLAHELRNPLAPIRNASRIIRQVGSTHPDVSAAEDMIDRQVQHLARLVDDLLDSSRITRGQIQLQEEPVDAAAVVARAVEVSKPLLESKRQELTVMVPEEGAHWVRGDPVRLAQVLTNLLNNASKFTPESGRVCISAARDGAQIVFRVSDRGIGIPPEMLGNIFGLFTQVDRSLDRSHGGLGIGLTLVKHLVELHNGTVHAFSAGPNLGSEFEVRLPLTAAPAVGSSPGKQARGPAPARRVLLVDDHVDAAASLAKLLRLQGHHVSLAHDGPTALQAAAAFRPEIVLLDIGLPGMDGYEVARRLRTERRNDVVIAALTGYGRDEDRKRSQAAGIDVHLVKPINLEMLRGLLAQPEELKQELQLTSAAADSTAAPA
jgi:signal transduction histidine kinase/DNA-binding response OmpR family regulator